MSDWTHAICDECWPKFRQERGMMPAEPHRLVSRNLEVCCSCLSDTRSGIFVRADPQTMQCKGQHAD